MKEVNFVNCNQPYDVKYLMQFCLMSYLQTNIEDSPTGQGRGRGGRGSGRARGKYDGTEISFRLFIYGMHVFSVLIL